MNTNDDRRMGGWISTLVALVVLVVVGFLCGALAGFLWEEPGLVVAHLTGKTEPVEWSATEPGPVATEPPSYAERAEAAQDGVAKLAAVDHPPEAAPLAVPAADPTPLPPPAKSVAKKPDVSAKPVEKKLEVQAKPAERKPEAALPSTAAGTPPPKSAPMKVAAVEPAGRFSVQVGAFADRASANKLVSRLRAKGYESYVKADSEGSAKRYRVRVGPVSARTRAEEIAAKLAKGEKLPTWVLDENKG